MKKYIVLAVLFVFPLVVYLFFASGVNHFAKLPVLTQNIDEIGAYSEAQFKDKITVLGFFGNSLNDKKALALNLNQKIYKRFYQDEIRFFVNVFVSWLGLLKVKYMIPLYTFTS